MVGAKDKLGLNETAQNETEGPKGTANGISSATVHFSFD